MPALRLVLITIQILFGVNYLASKIVVTEIGPGAWAALRTGSAFLVIALIALLKKRRLPPRRDIAILAVVALFGVVFNQGFFLEGLARTTVGRSALICSQIPTFVLLFSVISRQEQLTVRKLLGFAAGIIGTLVLLEADNFRMDSRYLIGDLLTLTNAASYGIFIVIGRKVMGRMDPLVATTIVFFWGAVGMIIYGGSDLAATQFATIPTSTYLAMVYVVIGATVVTYFLNLWAVKRVAASRVAVYIFLQPLLATTLGVVFRDEVLSPRFAIAAVLVLLALVLPDTKSKSN
ncbi:MAG: drug/metabolite transporter (DMT)-like permease [Candidatus Krumholzibacteriia bacterium]